MKIAIGCDPNAVNAKQSMITYLKGKDHSDITDFGSDDVIYSHVATKVGEAVASGEFDVGILICGTGLGMSIAANKVKGIRCAVCSEPYSASMARKHNNANMLAFGARVVGSELAKMIVDTFLEAEFEGGRHQRRVDMITAIEERN